MKDDERRPMTVSQFLDGLEAGGYWDDFCRRCERMTPHPEGFCTRCGSDEDSDATTRVLDPVVLDRPRYVAPVQRERRWMLVLVLLVGVLAALLPLLALAMETTP